MKPGADPSMELCQIHAGLASKFIQIKGRFFWHLLRNSLWYVTFPRIRMECGASTERHEKHEGLE